MKELIRRFVFVLVYLGLHDGEFYAEEGSLKFRFLTWLYGSGDAD